MFETSILNKAELAFTSLVVGLALMGKLTKKAQSINKQNVLSKLFFMSKGFGIVIIKYLQKKVLSLVESIDDDLLIDDGIFLEFYESYNNLFIVTVQKYSQ